MARYLERAENTARIINVNANLLLDLPIKVEVGWKPLVEITGSEALFEEHYKDYSEANVVRFLIGDRRNPGSILTALYYARENARTIRDIIPRESWENINELYMHAKDRLQSGYSKRGRYDYLDKVITGNQLNTGLLAGTMTHDYGYLFLKMGRNLERGDMTTRIIDVRSADLIADEGGELTPFGNIQWMSVLKSMTGYQMYRRQEQTQVRRPQVLRFLFQNRDFPRSVYHSVSEVENCLHLLPRNEDPLQTVVHLKRVLSDTSPDRLMQRELHDFIDVLQIKLAELHDHITSNYFAVGQMAQEQSQSQSSAA
jgi:uncharacterized alpha-E superfamily protein